MPLIHEAEQARDEQAAATLASAVEREAEVGEAEANLDAVDRAEANLDNAAAASRADLAANADARAKLRRQVDKTELRLAFRDLAEGVRGMIHVAPFTAILVGVATGIAFGARRRPRPSAPPRR
jgi:hypothetical protein